MMIEKRSLSVVRKFFNYNGIKRKRTGSLATITKKKTMLILIGCVLLSGAFAWVVFGSGFFDPVNTSWVCNGGGDYFQHYIGWRFYREAPWTRYLTFFRNLNYPVGTSTVVTDANPIVAMGFKVIRGVLPHDFQYNGLWILSCCLLTGWFGGAIGLRLTGSGLGAVAFMLFCLLNPVPLQRTLIHDTLAGHWLLLLAIWLTLSRDRGGIWIGWALVVFLTLGIHFYFFPMILFIAMVNGLLLLRERTPRRRVALFIAAIVLSTIAGYFFFGYPLVQGETGSYGELSLNLNAILNSDGTSRFLPPLATFPLQYEGYNYYGLGLLLFLGMTIALARKDDWRRWMIGIVPAVLLVFLATSNVVTFGRTVIIEFPLPDRLVSLLSVFRSSGRLIWPLYYLSLVAGFTVFRDRFGKSCHQSESDEQRVALNPRKRIAIGFVVICLIVQVIDLSGFIGSISRRIRNVQNTSAVETIDETAWAKLAKNMQHLAISDCDAALLDRFALFSIDHGLTFNRSANARGVKAVLGGDAIPLDERLQNGWIENGTLVVLCSDASLTAARERYGAENVHMLDGLGYLIVE